ncbi:MAG: hypothetical protein PVF82_13565 [Gammaproteobacteria bacterium]|jgi:hypothetical protein
MSQFGLVLSGLFLRAFAFDNVAYYTYESQGITIACLYGRANRFPGKHFAIRNVVNINLR